MPDESIATVNESTTAGSASGSTTVHLVRHGRPLIDRTRPAATWNLDPQGIPAIDELRASGRLPYGGRWFSSPEPKALATARRLTDVAVEVVDGLVEHRREAAGFIEDFPGVVEQAFRTPELAAWPGWEPLAECRRRVGAAVRDILARVEELDGPGADVVLVGHGTAWTVVVAELTGAEPDLARWRAMAMPDVLVVTADRIGRDPVL